MSLRPNWFVAWVWSLAEKPLDQFLPAQLKVGGHVGKDAGQGAYLYGIVIWDCYVVLAALRGGQSQVASGLSGGLITEPAQGFREIRARNISW